MSSKQFLYIILATFITIMSWVALDILHSRANVQTPPEIQKLLDPVNPNFDQSIVDEL